MRKRFSVLSSVLTATVAASAAGFLAYGCASSNESDGETSPLATGAASTTAPPGVTSAAPQPSVAASHSASAIPTVAATSAQPTAVSATASATPSAPPSAAASASALTSVVVPAGSASLTPSAAATAAGSVTAPAPSASGVAPQPSGSGSATPPNTETFTCTQLVGIDSTADWFNAGFETKVDNGAWQIIYNHPGYVESFADLTADVWNTSKDAGKPKSPCTTNSTNPDRVVFNVFADPSGTLKDAASFKTALQKAITNFTSKYSNLKRIEILTMTRAPNNMACPSISGYATVDSYTDEAVAGVTATAAVRVIALQKFYVPDCTAFDTAQGAPHLSTTGKTALADMYGAFFAAE